MEYIEDIYEINTFHNGRIHHVIYTSQQWNKTRLKTNTKPNFRASKTY